MAHFHRFLVGPAKVFPVSLLVFGAFATSCGRDNAANIGPAPQGEDLLLRDLPPGIFSQLKDPSQAPQPIEEASRAVVKLERVSGVLGSGVFVNEPSLLLTNAHVLGPTGCLATGCFLRMHVGHEKGNTDPQLVPKSIWVKLVPFAFSQSLDVAAYKVFLGEQGIAAQTPYAHPKFLALKSEAEEVAKSLGTSAQSELGEQGKIAPVYLVGNPLGYLKKVIGGRLVAKSGPFFNSELLTLPGTSGGVILNSAGEFLGLHHRGTQNLEYLRNNGYFGVSLSTAVSSLITLLEPSARESTLSVFKNLEDITTKETEMEFAEAIATDSSSFEFANRAAKISEDLWLLCEGERFQESVCTLAAGLIGCEKITERQGPGQYCPVDDQAAKWKQRFLALGKEESAADPFFWQVTAPLKLETREKKQKKAQEYFDTWYHASGSQRRVSDAVLAIDTTGKPNLGEQGISNWFKDFRKNSNYYYQYANFLRGVYLLGKTSEIPLELARASLQSTEKDPYATLGDALLADLLDWRLLVTSSGPIEGQISQSVYLLP